jgi:endo-1,4-beta-xylanase
MFKKWPLKTACSLILFAFVMLVVVTACQSPESPSTPTMVPPTLKPTNTLAPPEPTATQTAPPPTETATPEPVMPVVPPAEGTIQYTFEDGAQGWLPRGDASVSVVDDMANSGTHSLLVTNRTANWHGASVDVSQSLKPGISYEIGGYVRLAKGEPASQVIITMQRTPSGGSTAYEWIAPSTENGVTDSEWVYLQGRYSYSGEVTELLLYVESPDAELVSFYIDDITIGGQSQPPIQTDIPSVYETLADYFPVGAAFGPGQLDSENQTALLARHFNSLTPDNAMKPGPIQPSEGNFRWIDADNLVELAQVHNMAVHGHTLVWHQQAAEWMFLDAAGNEMTATPENKELLLKRLEDHIRAVVGRYKDAVNVWDVVNEVVDANRPNLINNPGETNSRRRHLPKMPNTGTLRNLC